jgi:hypothetical protein
MAVYDVFNGDADGVLALHQFRLAHPETSELITGVKRDVKLIKQLLDASDLQIQVFDISLESNEDSVQTLLDQNCSFLWFDHHRRGALPDSEKLITHIDLSPSCCTSILVDQHLKGQHHLWAIAAAYGDNLRAVADKLGEAANLTESEQSQLREIGETLNYNGYGEAKEDLNIWPADLYLELRNWSQPFDYYKKSDVFKKLQTQKSADENVLGQSQKLFDCAAGNITLLPKGPSSKRMSGIFSNDLVHTEPEKAHAIFTHLDDDSGYRISIRAPLNQLKNADTLAKRFPTGGGRAGAAGVNELPHDQLENFYRAFEEVFAC